MGKAPATQIHGASKMRAYTYADEAACSSTARFVLTLLKLADPPFRSSVVTLSSTIFLCYHYLLLLYICNNSAAAFHVFSPPYCEASLLIQLSHLSLPFLSLALSSLSTPQMFLTSSKKKKSPCRSRACRHTGRDRPCGESKQGSVRPARFTIRA